MHDSTDIQNNKGMAIVAYILFFIPLIAAKDSKFAWYHANQGLTLLVTAVIVNVILGIIPFIGWILLPLANLAIFILAILGIVAAAQGQAKPLPLIGKYTLLK
ncbi:hypothetical protein GCM10008018_62150 [Paenibacillus marchantiophytorum]|uniref:DUF4870 domain-containing protein n=1 Tax=Paenibacillus marchantiophytorum TaxID=1619310 RepID=A0ABQ1FDX3_9BACL|nr:MULTISPECIES: hypothetical protein [Paenibacillus]UKS29099.1 hypothetical protein LOZ80_09280 [Paenibacillus sp. HWE-109]GGA07994.1 hypothetical protein GCM10008018_62150 [Paenibacillus marchantiophytorum]